MPWLIGIAVVAVIGYFAVERAKAAASAAASQLGQAPAPPTSGMVTVAIDTATSTDLGAINLGPNASLTLTTYDPPANYQWRFFAQEGSAQAGQPATLPALQPVHTDAKSATFGPPPGGVSSSIVTAVLQRVDQNGALVMGIPPLKVYTMRVGGGGGPVPAASATAQPAATTNVSAAPRAKPPSTILPVYRPAQQVPASEQPATQTGQVDLVGAAINAALKEMH